MAFTEDSSLHVNGHGANSYTYKALAALLLLQESFLLRVEKLESALRRGIINSKEYDAWLTCLRDVKSAWLSHEIKTEDDILFLELLAQQHIRDAVSDRWIRDK
jgi:hypothetical protein